ncbi:fumarylacetoacetate hydrolase family protein [Paralcaligenes sp. KSB-10]|uniref:fumarylacetoacetate hydrolase family protein n=1 Tax=Paralcaligenes sp. KSB-10 TaxID=2901142 RepID=UPI001E2D9A59|nr:fumarylacetoacetate hydrolase family protein [Paralcaligenes sp. KSB-10]UHL65260.1 fumarylacetoacetate hydrolase family protein [Paralcaligenes sp. KSB-10]
MKLVRYGAAGYEKPGLIDAQGNIRDLSQIVPDIAASQFDGGVFDHLIQTDPTTLPLVREPQRLGVPYTGMQKIVAVGLNYSDHAAEAHMALPKEPILFSKAITSLNGPYDNVVYPVGCEKVDWEVELGAVIGKKTKNVSETQALEHVAGYCIVNDVSERELQIERSAGQWHKGKSLDTFCPVGPYLVTQHDIPNPQNLALWLDVNGVRCQTGHTSKMIFGVARLISYISQYITLMPGDLIATGTPPGVGMGMSPPKYLRHGDLVELGIDGLGQQCQKVVSI